MNCAFLAILDQFNSEIDIHFTFYCAEQLNPLQIAFTIPATVHILIINLHTFLGHGRNILEFNLPRDCIRNYFPSRKCFTFPQPVQERNMLRNLESLNKSQLDPDFIVMSDQFVEYVSKGFNSKKVEGRPVSGSGKNDSSSSPLFGKNL